jgi:uncharacterized protein
MLPEYKSDRFQTIGKEAFARFHAEFQGDTWDICGRCGGKCEINKIGSLMPGEAEYIAANLGVNLEEFRDTYLDGIVTRYGVVDVLKLKPGCPFLTPDFHCRIPDVKVVLCDVYPVVFRVCEDKVIFSLDPWCPIVRYIPELSKQFEAKGIPAIERLNGPVEWYRAVELYDGLCVDYNKLFALRRHNVGYVELTLQQVENCLDDDAPPPNLQLPSILL